MHLTETSKSILDQLADLTIQLSDNEYSAELNMLNGNTIGKHIRHIIEFFDMLITGSKKGLINYDKRNHNIELEKDRLMMIDTIQSIKNKMEHLELNHDAFLEVSYTNSDEDAIRLKSSTERELAYNIEHAVHHMAIIQIAIQTVFPTISLPAQFGVAFSTIRFKETLSNAKR
jgi:hypothetical protein